MKNIFILETEEKTTVQKNKHNKLFSSAESIKYEDCTNQFIYITNEEATKIEQWCFEVHNSPTTKAPKSTPRFVDDKDNIWWLRKANCNDVAYCETTKKIVLTNDPKLIADGVQELTEEQLKEIVFRYPLDYVEVVREEDGQFIEYSADGSVEMGVYENYSLCFNSFSAEKTLDKIIGEKMYEQRDLETVISKPKEKYIKEFEILEGIPYDKSDEKALAKFERYVERQEEENKEDFNNKDNWEFERSSGYAGYRNEMTGDWIYEKEYLEKFGEEKDKTAEKENYRRVFTQENGWQDERIYTEEELFTITLEAVNIGMVLRQNQLNGFSYESGNDIHKEWFEKIKK